MKLLRILSLRVLVVALLSGAVGLTSAFVVARFAARRAAASVAGAWLKKAYARRGASCAAAPSTWSAGAPGGPRAFAYDAGSLTSANPEAPPLDRGLLARLGGALDEPVVAEISVPLLGGAVMMRAAPSGPCAILQANLPAREPDRQITLAAALGALVAAAAAAALGYFLVVRPLARVRERTARLEQRRRDLERHLADVAHDLRTPLTSLQLAVEQAADCDVARERADLLAGALRDCVYLSALTSNLRLASQLADGWDPIAAGSSVDVTDTVERVVARVRVLARRRGIALEHTVPDGVVRAACNATAFEQAISNVIENAVSHGDRGGHVAVVLGEDRGGGFTLTVADDGPGVPLAEVPRLGERTFRSDEARRRDPRGHGLGLAITHEICARAGFSLRFQPGEPRGLSVIIKGRTAD